MIMVILFLFIVIGVAGLVLVLKFDKKQAVKINTVLKESRSVPPLFMLKSTEQKISVLKEALRYDSVPQNMSKAGTMDDIYHNEKEDNRQSKVHELKTLSAKYNNGDLSIEAYNVKLDELLEQVQKGSFGLAC
jgi:hypothetical protein